ncbi:GTP-binding protein [Pseudoalteromonas rubra]|uniref:Elongation factor Tu n=1 Tax=Pseudoalteromonas rubra TaxID=43658 RepID=A0A5S3X4H5_9GAMM|nr:GTP-binding protein [Pseudoalteromonas rubra]TMP38360.1 elongation factor Tu [Pseudoalteromonas rubra]
MASNDEFIKQVIFVDTIGAKGHGKTTLTAAITKVLEKDHMASAQDFAALNNAPQHKARSGVTFYRSEAEYESSARVCVQYDYPSLMDQAKGLISGISRVDVAILVVTPEPELIESCGEYLTLLRDCGVSQVVVFINKCDVAQGKEPIGLIEPLVREQLDRYWFDSERTPVIYGSALQALEGDPVWEDKIRDLVRAMDSHFLDPVLFKDQPFLMPVEDVFEIQFRGTYTCGRITSGTLRVKDSVELAGIRDSRQTTCSRIQIGSQPQDCVGAGDHTMIVLKGIPRDEIETGMVLCAKGTMKSCKRFEALLYCLTGEEGGRKTPLHNGFEGDFRLHYLDVAGTVSWTSDIETMAPGDKLNGTVRLSKSMAIKAGVEFEVRQYGQVVAVGRVTCPID